MYRFMIMPRPCARIPGIRRLRPKVLVVLWAFAAAAIPSLAPLDGVHARELETREELADLSLEALLNLDVVVGASRFEQHSDEAPASVTVITAEEIRAHQFRTLAEALNTIRGFYTTYDRNYEYVGARGFGRPGDYNTRLLILIDGQRVNDGIYAGAPVGVEFPLDMELVERIEVVRGPGSSLYGANAVLGFINVVTRAPEARGRAEAAIENWAGNGWRGRATIGGGTGSGPKWTFSGSGFDTPGDDVYFPELDDGTPGGGTARDLDGDQCRRLQARATWGRFGAHVLSGSREKEIPTGAWETMFNEPGTRSRDSFTLAMAEYGGGLGSDWVLHSRLSFHLYEYRGEYIYDYGTEDSVDPAVLRDGSRSRTWTQESEIERRWGDRHHLVLGYEVRRHLELSQDTWDDDWTYLRDDRTATEQGLFLQHEYRPVPNLILNLGIRHDRFGDLGNDTNPRLAAILFPDDHTTVKLLYGSAFRTPNTYELHYHDGEAYQKAAGSLRPESIETFELEVERHATSTLSAWATVYRYEIEDLISLFVDPEDELLVFRNLDAVRTTGVEFELRRVALTGVQGRANYSYQEARNRETGSIISNAPRHMAKLSAIFPLSGSAFSLAGEVQYVGSRITVQGGEAKDSILTNLTLQRRGIGGRVDLSLKVVNLFDARIEHPASEEHAQNVIVQDGRRVRLSLGTRF